MLGLRTQENFKFLRFWNIVQAEARKVNKTFFLDCGEGNEFENESIECENLSGWLIPDERLQEFQSLFLANQPITEKWEEYLVFVIWKFQNNRVIIDFE